MKSKCCGAEGVLSCERPILHCSVCGKDIPFFEGESAADEILKKCFDNQLPYALRPRESTELEELVTSCKGMIEENRESTKSLQREFDLLAAKIRELLKGER